MSKPIQVISINLQKSASKSRKPRKRIPKEDCGCTSARLVNDPRDNQCQKTETLKPIQTTLPDLQKKKERFN